MPTSDEPHQADAFRGLPRESASLMASLGGSRELDRVVQPTEARQRRVTPRAFWPALGAVGTLAFGMLPALTVTKPNAPVHLEEVAVGRHFGEADGCFLERRAVAGFAVAQRSLRLGGLRARSVLLHQWVGRRMRNGRGSILQWTHVPSRKLRLPSRRLVLLQRSDAGWLPLRWRSGN